MVVGSCMEAESMLIIHIVVATGISQLCSLYPAIQGVMGSISLQGNWQVASKSPI